MDEDSLMTTSQVAKRLSVDPRTVTRWAKEGRLKSVKLPGGHRRFERSEVERVITNEEGSSE